MSAPTLTGEEGRRYIENLKAQGVPVMKAHHDPRLLTMTPEEQQAYLAEFLENGPPPEGSVRGGEASAAAPTPGGGFRPTPLEGRCERFTLPNGQAAWVFPSSVDQKIQVNLRAIRDTNAAHGGQLTDADFGALDIKTEATIRAQVYQAIFCCRQGPEAIDPPFFGTEHADFLRREPGYAEAVEQISNIADRLMAGKGEAGALKEVLLPFLSVIGCWCKTWHSLLITDSSPQNMEAFFGALEDFGSSASALSQPTALSVGTLTFLTGQLQQQTPAKEPTPGPPPPSCGPEPEVSEA